MGDELEQVKRERDEALAVLAELQACRQTCPTILRFAVSVKEILNNNSHLGRK